MEQSGESNSKGKAVASSDPKSDLKCSRCNKDFHSTSALCGHQNAHRLVKDPKNMSPVLAAVLNNPLPPNDKPLLIAPGPKPAANPTKAKEKERVPKQPAAANASPRRHRSRRPDKKPIQEEEEEEVNSYGNPRKKPDGEDFPRLQQEEARRPEKRPIQEVVDVNVHFNPHKKPEGKDFLWLQPEAYHPSRRPDKRPIQEVNGYSNPHKKPEGGDSLRLQPAEGYHLYWRPDKRPILQEVEEVYGFGNPHKKPEGGDFLRLQPAAYHLYRRPDKKPIQDVEEVNCYGNPHKKPVGENFLRLQVLHKDHQYHPNEIALPEYTDEYSPQPFTMDLLGEWMPLCGFGDGGGQLETSSEKTISDPLRGHCPSTEGAEIDSGRSAEHLDLDLKLGF